MKTLLNEKIERQPMFLCGAIHRLFRNRVAAELVKQQLMTLEMSRYLAAVQENSPLNQQQLADIVKNERSATKRMVDNLVEHGYLTTSKSEYNKKIKMLHITPLGEVELKKVKTHITDIECQLFECLTNDEFNEFLRLIRKMGSEHLG
ncbi:MarR family winged helix-turn-helix transcriptional regulator [Vibrio sp.]|uniref:MarR family winged helix-turn-helix transcriptional regulator n=1 Tax=Vibrio sp. TaxID=678 RepID=UPI003AA8C01B